MGRTTSPIGDQPFLKLPLAEDTVPASEFVTVKNPFAPNMPEPVTFTVMGVEVSHVKLVVCLQNK